MLLKKWKYNEAVHQLFTVSCEVLYNIVTASDVTAKLFRLIKMCVNELKSGQLNICVVHFLFGMV
jgi:hypothetical protein